MTTRDGGLVHLTHDGGAHCFSWASLGHQKDLAIATAERHGESIVHLLHSYPTVMVWFHPIEHVLNATKVRRNATHVSSCLA